MREKRSACAGIKRGGTTFVDPRRPLLQCMHAQDSELLGRAGHTVASLAWAAVRRNYDAVIQLPQV